MGLRFLYIKLSLRTSPQTGAAIRSSLFQIRIPTAVTSVTASEWQQSNTRPKKPLLLLLQILLQLAVELPHGLSSVGDRGALL